MYLFRRRSKSQTSPVVSLIHSWASAMLENTAGLTRSQRRLPHVTRPNRKYASCFWHTRGAPPSPCGGRQRVRGRERLETEIVVWSKCNNTRLGVQVKFAIRFVESCCTFFSH